ncbi:MAG: ATP-binding protein, partial [Magnetococcales bacterium]|nr:ATP-binding protein [Magnetococcales bacterium]
MSLRSLKFTEGSWVLNETHFSDLNLLVGLSGVGKTRVLRAIEILRDIGLGRELHLDNISWEIVFNIDDHIYKWTGVRNASWIFLEEYISIDDKLVIERDHNKQIFYFNNKSLPKLKWTESSVTLLSGEDEIMQLQNTLHSIISEPIFSPLLWLVNTNTKLNPEANSLDELQSNHKSSLIEKGFALQNIFHSHFEEIKQSFIEIFPFVNDLRIEEISSPHKPEPMLTILIKDKANKNKWIDGFSISSGMLRTLKLLLELALAPKGTIFLIDEFENSLGINCLPQVADMIEDRQGEIQFILTSHHPYVINNIPWSSWKVVTRQGNT